MKRKRLSDLYVVGCDFTVVDDNDNGDDVWLQKLNPVEHTDAARSANAYRSRQKALAADVDSDLYQAALGEITEFADKDVLLTMALAEEIAQARSRVEAMQGDEEEWKKDDYLQGLVDLWLGRPLEGEPGLRAAYDKDPEDPEASKVFAELRRYDEQVEKETEKEIRALKEDALSLPHSELVARATEAYINKQLTNVFVDEYNNWMVYFGVRDPKNHSQRYFESVAEVRVCNAQVKTALILQMQRISVDPLEGKGSAATDASSQPSEPQEPVETEGSSSPQETPTLSL